MGVIDYDLRKIKALLFDIDGVLSANVVSIDLEGVPMRTVNIKDGYAIARLRDYGIEPVIITGRSSEIVKQRCAELKIKELHQGIENKSYMLRDVCEKLHVELSQVAYIGDDLNDLPCMKICGYSACPSDAMKQVKNNVSYVCETKGGDGAVREFIDHIISNLDKDVSIADYPFDEVKYEIQDNE